MYKRIAGAVMLLCMVSVLFADSIASFIVKDSAIINPYSVVTKTYAGPIRKIEVYNPNGLNIRVMVNQNMPTDKVITDSSAVIVSSTLAGVSFTDLTLTGTVIILLKGNTSSDTGNVPILIYK
jgi:hypothetical protein